MNKARQLILEQLRNICVVCDETDVHVLHVDHKYGQGYLEKEYFENDDDMFKFYLMNWATEYEYLQILCMNCNMKKRRENNENAGRPKLKELEKFLLYKKDNSKKSSREELTDGVDFLSNQRKLLEEFLEDYPQFIPIHKRMEKIYAKFEDFIFNYPYKLITVENGLNWLPKPYCEILKSELQTFSGLYSDVSNYKKRKFPKYITKDEPFKSVFE